MADATTEFMNELGKRGHDPLLRKVNETLRFDLVNGKKTDRWLVRIEDGDVTVSHKGGRADTVIRADREVFGRMAPPQARRDRGGAPGPLPQEGEAREGSPAANPQPALEPVHALFKSAERRELVRSNPASAVERPREPRRRWTILTPAEIRGVEQAFRELVAEAEDQDEQAWIEQARIVFLTVMSAGLRRGEILGLRWRNVSLADPAGATLRVRETWVRDQRDTPKSEKSERTIALGRLAGELFEHRGRSPFQGDDERVFCHPQTGGPLDHKRYAITFRAALARANVDRPMRPFHDGRHTSITNGAADGMSPAALMARAGHSDFATTQIYIDLAGETFRQEAERLDERLFGPVGQKSGHT
jgi:integrase